MTTPSAIDALSTGIAKVLQDALAQGSGVVLETPSAIADTVTDYLTWEPVQPLLRRFLGELDPDTDPWLEIADARIEVANVLGPLGSLATRLTLAHLVSAACQRSFEHGAAHAAFVIADALGPETQEAM